MGLTHPTADVREHHGYNCQARRMRDLRRIVRQRHQRELSARQGSLRTVARVFRNVGPWHLRNTIVAQFLELATTERLWPAAAALGQQFCYTRSIDADHSSPNAGQVAANRRDGGVLDYFV